MNPDDVDQETGEIYDDNPITSAPEVTVLHENWLLQVSIKTPGGTMINIRGADAGQLEANMQIAAELAPLVLQTERQYTGVGNAMAGLGATPQQQWNQPQQASTTWGGQQAPQQQGWGAPPQQQGQPLANAPMCKHGQPAKYVKGGISQRTGRPYPAFWVCAAPRGQECDFRQNG